MDKVEELTQKLNDAWNAASQDLYNAQQQAGGAEGGAEGGATNAGGANQGDVTDVEFEDVTEDKK